MNINEEEIRAQIREVIFNTLEPNEMLSKTTEKNVITSAYENLLVLKGFIEKKEQDKTKMIDAIKVLIPALNGLKSFLGKHL